MKPRDEGTTRPRVSDPGPEAEDVFGGRLPLATRYAALLAEVGTVRGLIGPREVPRLWERHLLNCAALADLVPPGATVCDLGSGAGLPGVVLAIRRPDVQVALVEPLLRRVRFLHEVVDELGLSHVEVVRERAEALAGRRTFAVVTARAVAPLTRLLPWALPLVEPGGVLLAMKGAGVAEEVAASREVRRRLGAADPEILELPVPGAATPAYVVRMGQSLSGRLSPAAEWDETAPRLSTGAGDDVERAYPQIAPVYPQERTP